MKLLFVAPTGLKIVKWHAIMEKKNWLNPHLSSKIFLEVLYHHHLEAP